MTVKITIKNDEAEGGHACEVHVNQPTKVNEPGHLIAHQRIEPGKVYSTYVHAGQYVQVHSLRENEERAE